MVTHAQLLELRTALAGQIGPDATESLMAILPPADERVATGSDIEGLRREIGDFRTEIRGDRDNLRGDMNNLRGDMADFRQEMRQDRQEFRGEMREFRAEMRQDFKEFKDEMKELFAASRQEMILQNELTRSDLTAQFRGELNRAVTGQTRALILANATALFGVGGLAVAFSRLL